MIDGAKFLSTPSARRATKKHDQPSTHEDISIHALREEGDAAAAAASASYSHFYPRPPRGGRHDEAVRAEGCVNFYPRPPRGGRPHCTVSYKTFMYFYPRPPRGGRQALERELMWTKEFLSTPSARRATSALSARHPVRTISIHALREEGDGGAVT